MSALARVFARKRRYAELSESIEEHIAEKTDELVESGMPRKEAEQAARREFGNATLLEQRSREEWQWPAVELLLADIRMAVRRLRKSPGFAATVILTLAIGIGANTAVFSVVNSVLLKPLPYPHPEELVELKQLAPGAPGLTDFISGLHLSASMYFTYAEHNRTFQSLGIWSPGTANVTGLAEPEEVHTALISDGVLEAFDVPAVAGRWISTADQSPHGSKPVMLGYGYWQRRFGGDPGVVGRSIQIDSQAHEIIGVMPRGFQIVDRDFDILIPMALDPRHQILAGFAYEGIGRLKPGATITEANADITRMLAIWMDTWTNGAGSDPHFYETWKITPALRPLKEQVIGNIGGVLWVVMGTIGVVMLIVCSNVANLLLVRAESRQQELAVRSALGAGRARIARELLVESAVLSTLGCAAGVGIALAALRLLLSIGPANLPRLSEIALDWRSLSFAVSLSLFSGLFFGLIPVFRYAWGNLPLLQGGARGASVGRDRRRGRDILVVAQVAMALVLIVSAVLMIRTFAALRRVDPGFSNPEHLQTMRTAIPASLVPDPRQATLVQQNILNKLTAIPGVTAAGFAWGVPTEGIGHNWDDIYFEGRIYPNNEPPMRIFNYVSPGYFHAAGTRFVAGRDFTWDDVYGLMPVGIISENLAREVFGSPQAALGQHFREYPAMAWHEVIGVVQDVSENGVDEKPPAMVYWPPLQRFIFGPDTFDATRAVTFAIRSDRAGTEGFRREVQQAVWSVNASLPVASVQTMQEIYSKSLARTSFTLVMLAIAGSMALLLGVIGIYGVISYAVAQRTREIGIRMALGAQRAELRWMFVRFALALTGAGVGVGLAAAVGFTRLMKTVLFGVSALDPITFLTVPLVLAAAAVLASYLPARRAASVDPVEALRAD